MKKACLVVSMCVLGYANACESTCESVKKTTLAAFEEIMKNVRENPEAEIREKLSPIIEKYFYVQRLVNIIARMLEPKPEEKPALRKLVIHKLPEVLTFSAKSYADSVFDIKEIKSGEKNYTIIGILKTKDGKLIKVKIIFSKEKNMILEIVIEDISWGKMTTDKIKDEIRKQGKEKFKKDMMEKFGK